MHRMFWRLANQVKIELYSIRKAKHTPTRQMVGKAERTILRIPKSYS